MKRSGFKKAKMAINDNFMQQQRVVETPSFSQPIDSEKIDKHIRRRQLDAISDALNQTGYFHKMSWPWLVIEFGGIKYPIYVSRYYPELKLALDLESDDNTELKKELCKLNKIHFYVVSNLSQIEEIKKDLGAVN